MTREEFKQMCEEKPEPLLATLHAANKTCGHNSDEYLNAFQALWENRIPHLRDHEIVNIMDTAKPHTQLTKGLETMGWLYDRLMIVCVERGI